MQMDWKGFVSFGEDLGVDVSVIKSAAFIVEEHFYTSSEWF
jgi:hypothetical protein